MSKTLSRGFALLLPAALLLALLAGACSTGRGTGAAAGAGVGAAIGQVVGKNTQSTLIGTAIGTGIGYIIGNEADMEKAKKLSQAHPDGTHNEVGSLGGTRWNVVSANVPGREKNYLSRVVEFKPNGRVLTTTTLNDGTVVTEDELYRVVGGTLIINKPGYLINARFKITGEEMIVDAEQFSAVLRKLPS